MILNSFKDINFVEEVNIDVNFIEKQKLKEIYKNSLWNKYNNKNDGSWINYKGNAVRNKYNRFK